MPFAPDGVGGALFVSQGDLQMAGRLYESLGQGGPLDGIKIGSGLRWDGRVVMRRTQTTIFYHAGYYSWDPIKETWIWRYAQIPPESTKRVQHLGRTSVIKGTYSV